MNRLFYVIAMLLPVLSARGQEPVYSGGWDFRAGLSWAPTLPVSFSNDYNSWRPREPLYTIESQYDPYHKDSYPLGNLELAAGYAISPHFTLSARVAAAMIVTPFYRPYPERHTYSEYTYVTQWMVDARFYLSRRENAAFYLDEAAGLGFISCYGLGGDLASTFPVFQSAFGARIGAGHGVYGFVELGCGTVYMGLCAGIGFAL